MKKNNKDAKPARSKPKAIFIYVTDSEHMRFKNACLIDGRTMSTQAHRLIFDWVSRMEADQAFKRRTSPLAESELDRRMREGQ